MTKSAITPFLLTPVEVRNTFRINESTLRRWANQGLLTTVRTLGGHRRYYIDEVKKLKEQGDTKNVEGI